VIQIEHTHVHQPSLFFKHQSKYIDLLWAISGVIVDFPSSGFLYDRDHYWRHVHANRRY
jgi:hypothetical protein